MTYNLIILRCVEGYYGDPRLGADIPCRQCPCPGTVESNHTFARHCTLDPKTQDVFCECQKGYKGIFYVFGGESFYYNRLAVFLIFRKDCSLPYIN